MREFPPRYPSVPTITTNRTPVGNTDANQKPMLIDDFSTNEPPLSWMMFEQANLRKQLVELNNQLAEAKAKIVRLREALREIYEVYAGSEGIPQPMSAAEGYLLSLLMEVVKIAQKALKEKE